MMLRRFGAAACAAAMGIALLPAPSFATDTGFYLRLQEAEKCAAEGGVYEHTGCRMPGSSTSPTAKSSFGMGEAVATVVIVTGFCVFTGLCGPAKKSKGAKQ
ncbi:MAG: hypothetical protein R3D70_24395 [Rhizobiaceae bacterium]